MRTRAAVLALALLLPAAKVFPGGLTHVPPGPLKMALDTFATPRPAAVAQATAWDAPPAATAVQDADVVPEAQEAPAGASQGKPAARKARMHGMAGGVVSLASDVDAKVEPWAWINVDVPTADSPRAPSMLVEAALSALPGESLDTADPATFRSLEFKLALEQPIAQALHFKLYGEVGFATRLPSDPTPRERTARWAAGGVRYAGDLGYLAVGIGGDQRLTGAFRPAVTIAGAVKLLQLKEDVLDAAGNVIAKKSRGPQMSLVGNAILGIDSPAYGSRPARDVVRVGVAVGI